MAGIGVLIVVLLAGFLVADGSGRRALAPGARPTTTTAPTTTTTSSDPFVATPALPLYAAARFGVTPIGCPTGQWKVTVTASWREQITLTGGCAPLTDCTENGDGSVTCSAYFGGWVRPTAAISLAAKNAPRLVVFDGFFGTTNDAGALALSGFPGTGQNCVVGSGVDGQYVSCTVSPTPGTYPSWSALYAAVDAKAAVTTSPVIMFAKLP